jgi:hypothetical protein
MADELPFFAGMSRPILAAIAFAIALCPPIDAQISMQRPGITGIPQGKKSATPARPAAPATLTVDEQKRVTAMIKHMKPKDRKKLSKALQNMTPQQRQQFLMNLKQQLAKQPPQAPKRGW